MTALAFIPPNRWSQDYQTQGAPRTGTRYVERSGQRFILCQVGQHHPGEFELISLGYCDDRGGSLEMFDVGPLSHRVPVAYCDSRFFSRLQPAADPDEMRRRMAAGKAVFL